jgi:hypothetical protein
MVVGVNSFCDPEAHNFMTATITITITSTILYLCEYDELNDKIIKPMILWTGNKCTSKSNYLE